MTCVSYCPTEQCAVSAELQAPCHRAEPTVGPNEPQVDPNLPAVQPNQREARSGHGQQEGERKRRRWSRVWWGPPQSGALKRLIKSTIRTEADQLISARNAQVIARLLRNAPQECQLHISTLKPKITQIFQRKNSEIFKKYILSIAEEEALKKIWP